MPQAYNYLPQGQPDITQEFVQGLQLSNALQQMRDAEQYKTDLQAALAGNDPAAFIQLSAKYPQQGAQLKQAYSMLGEEQRKAELNATQQIWYAVNSQRPDVALDIIGKQAEAMKNSGKDPSKILALGQAIQRDPQRAGQSLSMLLSTVAPKDFAETYSKLQENRRKEEEFPTDLEQKRANLLKTGAETDKTRADAITAAAKSRFAESEAAMDLAKKGWDITKIQEDIGIAKENSRIAALHADIAREGNEIRKQDLQLKLNEFNQKRDKDLRERVADVTAARGNIDNMLNTTERILKNPSLNSVLGSIEGRMPAVFSDEAADAIALIETLGSQVFLSQIPSIKGTGALSNAEGDKLQAALQNLSRKQSEGQFRTNLGESLRLMLKARENLKTRYGVPDTMPDVPAASATSQTRLPHFSTEADAAAAKLPKGTRVIINGVAGTWQ